MKMHLDLIEQTIERIFGQFLFDIIIITEDLYLTGLNQATPPKTANAD